MKNLAYIKQILENLTGQNIPISPDSRLRIIDDTNIDYGQFNELLLLFGYDRVTHNFFQFLVDGSFEYKAGSVIRNLNHLKKGVESFQKMALLIFGNVRYAFKQVSRNKSNLWDCMSFFSPEPVKSFTARQNPLFGLEIINAIDTYYLGYMIKDELKERLKKNKYDQNALEQKKKMDSVIEKGIRNHNSYLISDHMDVYLATSMRLRHEYLSVNRIAKEIFSKPFLKKLKLRWFDPTQAYCENRIDKGLSEALMLKRAKCTVYLAQESDTFGKDSELASTIAQGKPVIAYVPIGNAKFLIQLLGDLKSVYPEKSENDLMLEQLLIFKPNLAWTNINIMEYINKAKKPDTKLLKNLLLKTIKEHYDKRAKTLKETHPLGIQVCLQTGVANGVLVVRSINDCARIIKSIVTRNMQFIVEKPNKSNKYCLLLKEKISNSIFRVITNEETLTNSFWNFYVGTVE